jgi:hypothetical protein
VTPFVPVNLGALSIGRDDEAAKQLLLRAWMREGEEIFEDAEDALAFLSAGADPSRRP